MESKRFVLLFWLTLFNYQTKFSKFKIRVRNQFDICFCYLIALINLNSIYKSDKTKKKIKKDQEVY